MLIIALVLSVSYTSLKSNLKKVSYFPEEILLFADYLGFIKTEGDRLMARTPFLPYYGELEYNFMPHFETVSEMVDSLKKDGTRFLYFSHLEAWYRPWLKELLSIKNRHEDLLPIMEWRKQKKNGILYMIDKTGSDVNPLFYNNISFPKRYAKVYGAYVYKIGGLLKIPATGRYEFAFSGSDYAIEIDGSVLLSDSYNRNTSYVKKGIYLKAGFHLIDIRFAVSNEGVFPSGIFWETPDGRKGPIPAKFLILQEDEH